jgi:hypothetical protein
MEGASRSPRERAPREAGTRRRPLPPSVIWDWEKGSRGGGVFYERNLRDGNGLDLVESGLNPKESIKPNRPSLTGRTGLGQYF